MTQVVHADQVACSYMFILGQNTMSVSNQNKKHIIHLETKKPQAIKSSTNHTAHRVL